MTTRFGLISSFCFLLGSALPSVAVASPACRGCNIVDEGLLNQRLVGQTVYERTSKGFVPVTVERVGTYPPAIFWRSRSGDGAWNDARSYYSQQAYAELTAAGRGGSNSSYMPPIDREARDRLWTLCYSYIAAKGRAQTIGEGLSLWMMQRGCCQSTDAHRFGTPPGAC